MRPPTAALLWEIWRRHRSWVLAIVAMTLLSWLVHYAQGVGRPVPGPSDPAPLNELMGMLSFLFLFGIFSYTESSGRRGPGSFPRRLFTLPVSSLRLVAVPVLAGIASVELLYVLWMEQLSRGGSTSPLFIGVLLAAFMVFYQTGLWTLKRLGPLRLVVVGVIGVALFGVGFLPSFPASRSSPWYSETVLGGLAAALAFTAFVLAWGHVVRLRSGGGRRQRRLTLLIAWVADALPRRCGAFASPATAHFWFEWRCSGILLPLLVGGVLLVVVGPLSWLARNDPDDSLRLLLGTLAMPVVLAIPVGMAFSRPALWSDDLSVPAFVAARPLSADEMVAIKVMVAAVGAAIAWLFVLAFLCVWLPLWANLDALSRLAVQWWAVHRQSVGAVFGIAGLIVIAGMVLTWRFMVTGLWIGLSGSRGWFDASVILLVLAAGAGAVFDAGRLPGFLLEDPSRLIPFVWIAALAVIAKYWLAAYSWRGIDARLVRRYLLVWLAGTVCFVALAVMLWGVMRLYLPMDVWRFQSLLILIALMVVPLGRLGLAPSFLSRNRHRR